MTVTLEEEVATWTMGKQETRVANGVRLRLDQLSESLKCIWNRALKEDPECPCLDDQVRAFVLLQYCQHFESVKWARESLGLSVGVLTEPIIESDEEQLVAAVTKYINKKVANPNIKPPLPAQALFAATIVAVNQLIDQTNVNILHVEGCIDGKDTIRESRLAPRVERSRHAIHIHD